MHFYYIEKIKNSIFSTLDVASLAAFFMQFMCNMIFASAFWKTQKKMLMVLSVGTILKNNYRFKLLALTDIRL